LRAFDEIAIAISSYPLRQLAGQELRQALVLANPLPANLKLRRHVRIQPAHPDGQLVGRDERATEVFAPRLGVGDLFEHLADCALDYVRPVSTTKRASRNRARGVDN